MIWRVEYSYWIYVSETVDEEVADKEVADEETTDVEFVEAVISFSLNKTLAIWISQILLGLI